MNRLDFLIDYLINEDPQYSEMRIPEDLQGKRDLFRALRNVREPKPVSEEFLRLQDEELLAQLQEKGVVELDAVQQLSIINSQFSILLWQGDITRLRVDAIVNAANAQMLGCFHPLHRCIDNAIHSAAGVQLREECHDGAGQNHQGVQPAVQVRHPHRRPHHPRRHPDGIAEGTIGLLLPKHYGLCR